MDAVACCCCYQHPPAQAGLRRWCPRWGYVYAPRWWTQTYLTNFTDFTKFITKPKLSQQHVDQAAETRPAIDGIQTNLCSNKIVRYVMRILYNSFCSDTVIDMNFSLSRDIDGGIHRCFGHMYTSIWPWCFGFWYSHSISDILVDHKTYFASGDVGSLTRKTPEQT